MKWLKDLKIKTKLLTSFILIALLVGVVGGMGILNTRALQDSDKELYGNMTVPISQVGEMSAKFQMMRVSLRDMILANDAQTIKNLKTNITEQQAKIDELSVEYEKSIETEEMQQAFDTFSQAKTEYAKQIEIVMNLATQNQDTEAFIAINPDSAAGKATVTLQDTIENLSTMKLDEGLAKSMENSSQADQVVTTMSVIMVVSMILAVALGLLLSSLICTPLKKANQMILGDGQGAFEPAP